MVFPATTNATVVDDEKFIAELIETPVAQCARTHAARLPGIKGRAIGASARHLTMPCILSRASYPRSPTLEALRTPTFLVK